jgi:hypothetical protein
VTSEKDEEERSFIVDLKRRTYFRSHEQAMPIVNSLSPLPRPPSFETGSECAILALSTVRGHTVAGAAALLLVVAVVPQGGGKRADGRVKAKWRRRSRVRKALIVRGLY